MNKEGGGRGAEELTNKKCVDGLVFVLLCIRRHLSQSVRKMGLIPNLPLIRANIDIFLNKKILSVQIREKVHFTYSYLIKIMFGKYLELRKEITGFA